MMKRTPFTSDRQIYLDSKGQPVDGSSNDKQILFLGTNATISYERALEVGIIDEAGNPFYETQAFSEPSEVQATVVPGRSEDRLVDVEPLTVPDHVKVPRQRRQRVASTI